MAGGLMPTYEEAKRCPKCKQPGRLKSVENPIVSPEDRVRFDIQRGAKVETYVCINERCRWFETGWVVQLNPDGSIPDRTQALAKDKHYDTDDAGEMARIDHDLFQDDPAAAFEALEGGVDYEIKVEVESL
jgi:hypothetical protein